MKKNKKQLIKNICEWLAIGIAYVIALCSCSTTRASVKGLAENTTTTITITTNNPVTTNTTPNVELNTK